MGFLQHAEVDMVGRAAGVKGAQLPQQGQLLRGGNGENPLPGGVRVPFFIKLHPESLSEQPRQPLGKGRGLCDDLHLGQGKPVAVQQHPAGLRLGAALPAQLSPAQLRFHLSRKRHKRPPPKQTPQRGAQRNQRVLSADVPVGFLHPISLLPDELRQGVGNGHRAVVSPGAAHGDDQGGLPSSTYWGSRKAKSSSRCRINSVVCR